MRGHLNAIDPSCRGARLQAPAWPMTRSTRRSSVATTFASPASCHRRVHLRAHSHGDPQPPEDRHPRGRGAVPQGAEGLGAPCPTARNPTTVEKVCGLRVVKGQRAGRFRQRRLRHERDTPNFARRSAWPSSLSPSTICSSAPHSSASWTASSSLPRGRCWPTSTSSVGWSIRLLILLALAGHGHRTREDAQRESCANAVGDSARGPWCSGALPREARGRPPVHRLPEQLDRIWTLTVSGPRRRV